MFKHYAEFLALTLATSTLTLSHAALAGQQLALLDAKSITVEEWDKKDGTMGLGLSAETIKTGEISFAVENKTEMKMTHEILIVPKPKDIGSLALVADGTKLDEEKLDGLKEVVELEPGEAKSKLVFLAPGEYLVFCNQVGHFAAGMHRILTVTP